MRWVGLLLSFTLVQRTDLEASPVLLPSGFVFLRTNAQKVIIPLVLFAFDLIPSGEMFPYRCI